MLCLVTLGTDSAFKKLNNAYHIYQAVDHKHKQVPLI